jgi:ABC-type Co2+ transport system permease subunit
MFGESSRERVQGSIVHLETNGLAAIAVDTPPITLFVDSMVLARQGISVERDNRLSMTINASAQSSIEADARGFSLDMSLSNPLLLEPLV